MNDDFERYVSDELERTLPKGWQIDDRASSDAGFDLVARSPNGNVFPIEIKSGSGLLDASAVVEFGAAVEESVPLLEQYQELRDSAGPIQAEEDAQYLVIKPMIITSLEVTETSADYATDFHIDLLRPAGETTAARLGQVDTGLDESRRKRYSSALPQVDTKDDITDVGIGEQVVSRLTYWDKMIQLGKAASSSKIEMGDTHARDWLEFRGE